ncbi:KH domain-containing protein [Patescibacteria group bacterium]|nr:KH domain-containing protein [Patescibacteria group bacterium]
MELEIRQLLKGFFDSMGIDLGKTEIEQRDDGDYYVNITSADSAMLIGYHGDNLPSFQHLLRLAMKRKNDGEMIQLVFDVDGYRKRQEDGVITMAERKVDAARMTSEVQILPPMSPYFRRVVHLYLRKPEFADINAESTGMGETRRVVINPNSV